MALKGIWLSWFYLSFMATLSSVTWVIIPSVFKYASDDLCLTSAFRPMFFLYCLISLSGRLRPGDDILRRYLCSNISFASIKNPNSLLIRAHSSRFTPRSSPSRYIQTSVCAPDALTCASTTNSPCSSASGAANSIIFWVTSKDIMPNSGTKKSECLSTLTASLKIAVFHLNFNELKAVQTSFPLWLKLS